MTRWLPVLALALGVLAAPAAAAVPVASLTLDGAITPITVRLVELALAQAQADGASALLVRLDTPGGLERSTRSIVQRMLAAEIPVVVYVSPTGARAASAGVFITMAAHVAAMAPATNIGAAHPVALGGGQPDEESARKLTNDTAAFARTIAAARGRNAEWAERAVRESVSITEREAVALNVVDLVAESVPDLLAKVDGRRVTTARGPVTLQTRDAAVQPIEIGLRDRVLAVITDPNVAYLLMMAGMLGLFFELANPGALVPGIVGGISLILAFFAFQSLPINYAGLLLILFGLLLFVAEVKVASHGALAVGGTIALALGSLMLYDAPELGFRVAWPVVIVTVGLTALLVAGVLALGLRALRRRPALEAAGLLGRTAVALEALAPEGQVTIQGETWRAVADGFVPAGGRVTVTAVAGLTLRVAKTDGGGEEGT